MSDNVIDHNMSAQDELHLFIFEGGSAEPLYVRKLEQNFMGGRISVKIRLKKSLKNNSQRTEMNYHLCFLAQFINIQRQIYRPSS